MLEDWAEPDADQLCEVGWLERRTVNDTDDVAYFWTREAETALDMNAHTGPSAERTNGRRVESWPTTPREQRTTARPRVEIPS